MQWAKELQTLLEDINKHQIDAPNLDEDTTQQYREKYRKILTQGDISCPPPDKSSEHKPDKSKYAHTEYNIPGTLAKTNASIVGLWINSADRAT